MTVGELNKMTQGLSPDTEVVVAIGDVIFPIIDEESGVTNLKPENVDGDCPVLMLTPNINP